MAGLQGSTAVALLWLNSLRSEFTFGLFLLSEYSFNFLVVAPWGHLLCRVHLYFHRRSLVAQPVPSLLHHLQSRVDLELAPFPGELHSPGLLLLAQLHCLVGGLDSVTMLLIIVVNWIVAYTHDPYRRRQ